MAPEDMELSCTNDVDRQQRRRRLIRMSDLLAKNGVPSFHGQEFAAREEATKIMEMIRERNKSKEINIVVECLVGFVRDTIQHMIKMYEPTMLVVGTRGHSKVKGFLLGSISRYCLHYSPIPVIVVRPASKLVKSKNKSKGIFRRRTSFQVDAEEIRDTQPQLFYSSPVSRQTSRSSSDTNDTISKVTMEELGRKDSRSPEPSYPYHQHHRHSLTAAEKASAAKKGSMPSIFSINPTSTLTPPTPSDSISSSLSYASAMLSSSPPANKPSPPPEGFIKMRKSVTSDGISGSYWSDKEKNADREKKSGNRGVFAKLSGSIFSGPRTRA
ncbi:hypothetical protein BX616_007071 [Lobosporangium transversale]|nr:hypothetical protein BX616_007071 [Lobosporangium transversale]